MNRRGEVRFMKTRLILLCIIVSCSLLLVSCPLPNMSTSGTPGIGQVSNPGFTVETDSARGLAVFVDAEGTRIDIAGTEEDGTVVACVEAIGVTALPEDNQPAAKGLGGRGPALVIGRRADGKPGLWIVKPDNTVECPLSEKDGTRISCLPESDERFGTFRGLLGWVYHVMGVSEDGKLIAGYAENPKGFSHGRWKIEAGTTIGVYWRVWKHPSRPCYIVSRARIIGTRNAPTQPVPDKGGHHDKGDGHWRGWLRHGLAELKLFLLDSFTSYLIMVDKNGVTSGKMQGAYEITGTDQDSQPAIATIDSAGTIVIEQVTTGPAGSDLQPGSISFGGEAAADGQNLAVTLPIANLLSDAVAGSFDVHFYLASTSAFSPSDDTDLGAVTVTGGVAGNSSVTASASLPIPELNINEVRYLYAVVDSTGVVTEDDETNNQSTKEAAAAVLIYDDENASRTYDVIVQTYLGSDPSKNTGSTDTVMGLYRNISSAAAYLAADMMGATDFSRIDKTNYRPLVPGKYYVVVLSWTGRNGPYALAVRTANIDLPTRADLASNAMDTWEPDDVPATLPLTENKAIPAKPDPLKVGAALSRYSDVNDYDWFTFTLP
jgi:hypothetical protein